MRDHDELINEAFRGLVSAAGPYVRPAGTGAVRATVRHRRTARVLAIGTLSLFVAAVPVTAYTLTPHGGQSLPTGPAPRPTTASTSAPAAATPATTPAATPSATVPAGPSGAPGVAVTSVSGVVRDARTNAGLGGALVALQDASGHEYRVTTNSSGQFVFRSTTQHPIAPGRLAIGVAANGFQNQVEDNVDGQAGQAVTGVVLVLQPAAAGPSADTTP